MVTDRWRPPQPGPPKVPPARGRVTGRHTPLSVTPGMTRAAAPVPPGVHSSSPPTAATSSSRRCRVDATVASRIGSARAPPPHHQALDADREVARHRVDARVQAAHRLHEHAVVDAGEQIVERARARRDGQRLRAHPGRRAVAAHGRGRRRHAGPPAGHRVVEEALQHAALDQRDAARGQALAVVAVRAQRPGIGGIVDEREQRRGDRLADPVGERRPALEHRLAVERARHDAQQGGGHARLEHQGDHAAGRLDRARAGGWRGRRRRRPPRRGRCRRARARPTRRSRSWSRRRPRPAPAPTGGRRSSARRRRCRSR